MKKTKNVVRENVGDKILEKFCTEYRVRQSFPMSPILYNIFIWSKRNEKRRQEEGIPIGKKKIGSIAYVNDID